MWNDRREVEIFGCEKFREVHKGVEPIEETIFWNF